MGREWIERGDRVEDPLLILRSLKNKIGLSSAEPIEESSDMLVSASRPLESVGSLAIGADVSVEDLDFTLVTESLQVPDSGVRP